LSPPQQRKRNHGPDEQIFGAERQAPGRGQSDKEAACTGQLLTGLPVPARWTGAVVLMPEPRLQRGDQYKTESTMDYLRSLIAAVVVLASIMPATAQNSEFGRLLADTGCDSKYSDDKKADLFKTNYYNREMTISGEITNSDNGKIYLKLLRQTLTFDLTVNLRDPKAGYDLEKGQRVTVRFNLTRHGGCFLAYSGDNGVIIQ
jgi:hypothetical protein